MGTGASNQVRSRSESTSEIEAACSLSGYSFKPTTNENILAATKNVADNQSETIAHQNHKIIKSQKTSQKPEVRSLPSPSYHVRKSSQEETEGTLRNLPRHELHQKIRELELALAMSESHKLDLQDRVQALEEQNNPTIEQHLPAVMNVTDTLHETLNVKDQQIKKLEEDLKNVQTDFQKKTLKFKKRIRGLTKQVFELRQEALITQMEQKEKITQQYTPAENHQLNTSASSEDKGMSHLGAVSNTSHTKIVVELSSQISEQEEQIARLTAEVAEKDKKIEKLNAALKEARTTASAVPAVPALQHSETFSSIALSTADRAHTSRGEKHENSFSHITEVAFSQNKHGASTTDIKSSHNAHTGAHHRPVFEHHSTVLSDSDSDWDEKPSMPQVHRHSAPAQSRMRSNMSTLYSTNTKSKDMNLQSDDKRFISSLEIAKSVTSDQRVQAEEKL